MNFEDSAGPNAFGLESYGFRSLKQVHWNSRPAALYEMAIQRAEGRLAANGPLVVLTGRHSGRSASDKFIVKDAQTADQVWWDNNSSMTPEAFETLHGDMMAYAAGRELFAQNLFAGADSAHRLPVRIVTERAWHSLFARNLLIRPDNDSAADFTPAFGVIDLPGFVADSARHGCVSSTVIAVDMSRRLVLIGGTSYAGEIKKSVFTILNYLLPVDRIMPMHCSANVGASGDVAILFGLSGTGKTTLSADAARTLVGDDEHGWGVNGVFNFEGGCYAKVIRLSREAEPEIFAAAERFGTVLENVVCDPATGALDLDDGRYTENTRAAYPIGFIPNASTTGRAGHPSNVVMLTADAFGVLPPIAKLTPSQAIYHFHSGFTPNVAGT
jgi:phosphoenolpyruvate carboxykinase (ATP)